VSEEVDQWHCKKVLPGIDPVYIKSAVNIATNTAIANSIAKCNKISKRRHLVFPGLYSIHNPPIMSQNQELV
jgi:hypothetical protein